MARFETLKPQMEAAYFESFSGISPLLDTKLPNEPDWTVFEPDYSVYTFELGNSLLDNNRSSLQAQGVKIEAKHVPQIISDLLTLTPEETYYFLDIEQGEEESSGDELIDKFLIARYLSDILNQKFDDPKLVSQFIRQRSWIYGDRSMIEMVAEGEGALLVGLTYKSFDFGTTA